MRPQVLLALCLLIPAASRGDAVDDYVRDAMRRHDLPAVTVAVVRDGKLLKAEGYGVANVELESPATAQTVYQLASMTKPVTAAGIMLLVEDGKLRLDARVADCLDGAPPAWDRVTVRHLLTMTSGLKDYATEIGDSKEDFDEAKLFRTIAGYAPLFAPGEKWAYCNSNYVLLGQIVHKVTGSTWPPAGCCGDRRSSRCGRRSPSTGSR